MAAILSIVNIIYCIQSKSANSLTQPSHVLHIHTVSLFVNKVQQFVSVSFEPLELVVQPPLHLFSPFVDLLCIITQKISNFSNKPHLLHYYSLLRLSLLCNRDSSLYFAGH